jgi:hypothetical protein
MKSDAHFLVTCASWEARFLLGLQRLLKDRQYEHALVLYSDEYAMRTKEAREKADKQFREHGVDPAQHAIYGTAPERTWKETLSRVLGSIKEGSRAVVDITTMPREIIWQTFWFLEFRKCSIEYVYNRPEGYGDWLSRDPDSPRLVYKMSGVSQIGARTALVVLAGYDVDRVRHLVDRFEPAVMLLGLQTQSVDAPNTERMQAQQDAFKDNAAVVQFWLDAYSGDHGISAILDAIEPYQTTHNLLMASMGPKLSAVALYQLNRRCDEIGLVYLPSREFNPDYSQGIGESIWGSLPSTQ